MKRGILLTFAAYYLLFGCADRTTNEISFATSEEYQLAIKPNAREEIFELTLSAQTARSICIGINQWPNRLGQLHMGSDLAYVVAGGSTYPATDRNFGYCPGEACVLKLKQGEKLQGRIAFSEFQGWKYQTGIAAVELKFPVRPYHC